MADSFDLGEPPQPAKAEAYRVLARKYRPTVLSELVGQDVLVRTLSNAFQSGRIHHAFLLTGVRGIGKTTTARIIARALNCTGPDGKGGPTINPCGVCDNCRAIAASSSNTSIVGMLVSHSMSVETDPKRSMACR